IFFLEVSTAKYEVLSPTTTTTHPSDAIIFSNDYNTRTGVSQWNPPYPTQPYPQNYNRPTNLPQQQNYNRPSNLPQQQNLQQQQ
ncbi:4707_t:CDS:2, partial [Dentiscutata heterogama]